jgi:hypothetical protein
MEKLHESTNATQYFSFATRKHVGAVDKALSQRVESREAWDMWEIWVSEALVALGRLHELGYIHGAITPTSLRVEETTLKLGGLQQIRSRGSLPPIDVFQANTLYTPPELLIYWGTKQGLSLSSMIHALKQENWPMDQIASFFPDHDHSPAVLQKIYEESKIQMPELGESSDVWMLGYSLLTVYAEMLQNPFAITSEFYKNRHEEFLDLLGTMVRPDPLTRPRIHELAWTLPTKTSEPSLPSETPVPSFPSETSAPSAPSETSAPSLSVRRQHRRLVLNAPTDPVGRNKTRRNPRN